MSERRICFVSPCRNEADYLVRSAESVISQTRPPTLWIIVDDGSTDGTSEILARYERQIPWIRIVRREDRGERSVGPGVIETFYAGLSTVDLEDYDYLCKLDVDLDLPPSYFDTLIDRMEENPRIGTCSGKAWFRDPRNGRAVSEKLGDETSAGMTKLYRTTCFRQIGGFVRAVMWDGIDCHRCRQLGWIAVSWDEPDLRFEHLRPMGSSHRGIWTGRMRHGAGQYFMGTGLLYMLASGVFRATRPPILLGGLGMIWGYLRSFLSRRERFGDPEFRRFLRGYQRDCLILGKRRATARLNERRGPLWLPEAEAGIAPADPAVVPRQSSVNREG